MLHYRSYVAQALTYDRVLVFDPPAEFAAELEHEMIVDERRADIWLFRPAPQRSRSEKHRCWSIP